MPDTYCEIQVGGPRAKRRGIALVDVADAEAISVYTWHMTSKGYAARTEEVGGKRQQVRMHRQLLGLMLGDPRQTDHVNGNKLDNRRENLRICTDAQNRQNLYQCGLTRGTYWNPWYNCWGARVMLAGKRHYLGYFDTREEAAAIASAFRREHMPFSADAREGLRNAQGRVDVG